MANLTRMSLSEAVTYHLAHAALAPLAALVPSGSTALMEAASQGRSGSFATFLFCTTIFDAGASHFMSMLLAAIFTGWLVRRAVLLHAASHCHSGPFATFLFRSAIRHAVSSHFMRMPLAAILTGWLRRRAILVYAPTQKMPSALATFLGSSAGLYAITGCFLRPMLAAIQAGWLGLALLQAVLRRCLGPCAAIFSATARFHTTMQGGFAYVAAALSARVERLAIAVPATFNTICLQMRGTSTAGFRIATVVQAASEGSMRLFLAPLTTGIHTFLHATSGKSLCTLSTFLTGPASMHTAFKRLMRTLRTNFLAMMAMTTLLENRLGAFLAPVRFSDLMHALLESSAGPLFAGRAIGLRRQDRIHVDGEVRKGRVQGPAELRRSKGSHRKQANQGKTAQ